MSVASAQSPARSIESLLQSVSASRLTTWMQCRLKFWFRYLSGIKRPKSVALHVGSVVHSTLKHWNMQRWRQEKSSLKQLYDFFIDSWGEELKKEPVDWRDADPSDQIAVGWRLLETYFRESPIGFDEKPEAVEVSVEAELKHELPKLVGIIDLVRKGRRIVDFKSSSTTPHPSQVAHQTEIQTTIYSLIYREATGKKESAIELHHLVKLKLPKLVVTVLEPASGKQANRLLHVIESYVNGLEAQDFIPAPGLHCVSCEFFNECRKWS